MPVPVSPTRSTAPPREAAWWLLFAGAALLSFAAFSFDAVAGDAHLGTGIFSVALASVAGLCAAAAYLGLAQARGILSVGWPGLLFPAAFVVFHFGSLGYSSRGWYREEWFDLAWELSVVCLVAWMLGYMVARGRRRVQVGPRAVHGGTVLSRRDLAELAWWGTVVSAAGLAVSFAAFTVIGIGDVFLSHYMRSRALLSPELGGAPAYVFAIAKLVMVVGVTVTAAAGAVGSGRVLPNRVFAVVLAVYLLVLLALGDRSEFSMAVFPVFLFRHAYVRPYRWRDAVLVAAGLLLVFTVVKATRAATSLAEARYLLEELGTVRHLFEELGYTLDTVIRSLDVVPADTPYFWGTTYAHAVARALPNLTFTPRTWGFVSSQWINWETAPELARRGNALGFSIVAEAYINFGLVGAPVVHLVIGWIHGRLERCMTGSRISIWAVSAFAVATVCLLMHVRNTVVLYIRMGLWMLAILAGMWAVYTLWRSLRRAPEGP